MRFKIHTLGCKVNQCESQVLREYLIQKGLSEVRQGPADLYIVNSCTVTHTADAKSLKSIRRARAENPQAAVIATGCLAEDKDSRIKGCGADYILGNREKSKFVDLLKVNGSSRSRAFIKVQDGCDNHCSFCKVRLMRGPSRSRAFDQVLSEVAGLSEAGFYEIVLCGINLGSFRWQGKGLYDLLIEILGQKGIGRIRLSSLEPPHITPKLISLFAADKRLCPHLHIPFQSGSTKVLRAMNKPLTAGSYLRLIEKIRKQIPQCGISCDLMVGFPGEEEADFQETLKLIDFCRPVRTHIFPYSRRTNTPSWELRPLSPGLVKERLVRAKEAAKSASFKFRQGFEGKQLEVIIDSKTLGESILGYSANYIRVKIDDFSSPVSSESLRQPHTVKVLSTGVDYSSGLMIEPK